MNVRTSTVPPGGWHFKQGDTKITGSTYDELLDRIFAFRLRAGIPPGNVKADVDAYYCGKWPQACNPPSDTKQKPGEHMDTHVSRWAAQTAANQPRGGYELVNQNIADQRAEICAACPKNVPWQIGCRSCSKSTATILMTLRRMRNTPSDPGLKACGVFGHENQTAVHLDKVVSQIDPASDPLTPETCWKRTKELQ